MVVIQPLIAYWEKLSSRIPFLARLYSYYYRQVVQNEIELAGINENDVVLNIGCGAVPFTAIYVAKKTKAKVIAVDKDRKAAERARICFEQMDLSDQVRVIECDGSKCIPAEFTVAVVALQAEPKALLLENLLKAATPGGRLVFRKPSKNFENHYDHLPKSYSSAGVVRQNMKTFDSSVLYIK